MAQKQFKIGLSNTDKQNMAQDVYERVLALTFNEYNTTTQYDVGDFVVYNDQLYKCIGSTSGAWDSTKWQLATLNDLVDDIENAVAFVNDKANVDGNYPTMTVGVADQLSPYDESSGDDQDEPFSFQATGTGNGSQPDFSTGSIALMKEKQGNTVVVNQLYTFRGSFVQSGITYTNNNDGTITLNGTNSTESNIDVSIQYSSIPYKNGHKYLWGVSYISDDYYFICSINGTYYTTSVRGVLVITATQDGNVGLTLRLLPGKSVNKTFRPLFIDLTQWFNGNIPQDLLDHPENFFRYYQGSLAYNTGTLVNANGRYIKCIGMNQWDEEWELGTYDVNNGIASAQGLYQDRIRSKKDNPIKAISGATYFAPQSVSWVLCYDKDLNYLGKASYSQTTGGYLWTTLVGTAYIRFNVLQTYGTTYNHDISINLYYEDEERCLTYEPYEVLTNNDTGNEILRSAGNVKDYKTPDGTIHRRVGRVDLGDLNWFYNSDLHFFFSNEIEDIVSITASDVANILCAKYVTISAYTLTYGSDDKVISLREDKRFAIKDTNYTDATALKQALTGVYLFYELAEPTTEQGTPYSENLVIDDFGSMDFAGNNGVPQGNLIFYPVDYKAFVDTLYKYTDGAPSKIALKSDLAVVDNKHDALYGIVKENLGGILRHQLADANSLDFNDTGYVDLGTLSWSYTDGRFYATLDDASGHETASAGNILCSKYPTKSADDTYLGTYGISIDTSGKLWVRDTYYGDNVNGFKASLNGILIAYEKA